MLTPRQARDLGVAIIFQEFQDASTLTVAENISLGRIPNRYGFVVLACDAPARPHASSISSRWTSTPIATVGTLRVGERQIVEIARSLSGSARLLILDEPTAALSHHEAEVLFGFIRRLRDQGVAIIYITHRLDEVTQIADRVQVLRDGATSLLTAVKATDRRAHDRGDDRAAHGRGGTPGGTDPRHRRRAESCAGAGAGLGDAFHDVDVSVKPGEVVALFGKLGSGAAEVGETAFGVRHLDRRHAGGARARWPTFDRPAGAIAAGIGFLPADRKAGGAFLVRPVAENVAVASWPTWPGSG